MFYTFKLLFAFDVFIIAYFQNKTVAFATNCEKIRNILIFIFFLLFGCAAPNEQKASYEQVSMKEAIVMMEEETDYIILDVRTAEEFAEHPDKEKLIFLLNLNVWE